MDINDIIEDAIWNELRLQSEEPFGPCVGRNDDLIDGHVSMDAVVSAILRALNNAGVTLSDESA